MKDTLRTLYPECFFTPQYPYSFKFDLILKGENFGELEIIVKEGLMIEEIKGSEKTLKKLDEIAKKQEGNFFYLPQRKKRFISYPVKKLNELKWILIYEDFEKNGDFGEIGDFLANTYAPVKTELLYQKTGIEMDY